MRNLNSLVVAALLLIAFAFAQSAKAEVVLDQEYVVGYPGSLNYYLDYPGDHLAQTFTARHSGILTGVGVQVSRYANGQFPYVAPIDDLHISVVRIDSNGFALVNEVLAKATIDPNSLQFNTKTIPGPIADVDLTSWQVPVRAGDKLAIAFSSNQTAYSGPPRAANYMWFRSTSNAHPGGEFSIYSPKLYGPTPLRNLFPRRSDPTGDAGFRVYIDVVPESTTLTLLAIAGSVALAARRW